MTGFYEKSEKRGQSPLIPKKGSDPFFPDPSPWFDVWREGTERARRRTAELRVDIAYGNRANERFDLYLPTHRPRNLPFVAFVHGSEWRHAMRVDSGFAAKAIHRHGAAFIIVGFDAVPAVGVADQVEQVRKAWRYIVKHATRFGLDPARGHLAGHCSGAHLAALTAFDPPGVPPLSVVLLSGIYDLEPVRLSTRNEFLGLSPEMAVHLSPIHRVRRSGPSVLVAWGANEPDEYRRQSRNFARTCKMGGLRVIHGEFQGRGHFDMSLELADPHSEVLATLRSRDR